MNETSARSIPNDGLLCPHCRVDLTMSDRQGIEIDYCPKCRGVWLDRGELDKIIERNAAYESRPPAPQAIAQPQPVVQGTPYPDRSNHGGHYDDDSRGHGGHGRRSRGHGGFLGRLFD